MGRSGGGESGAWHKPTTVADLLEVPLLALRPTQMAVGMRSVKCKRRKIERRSSHRNDKVRIDKLLRGRPIPVVRGPKGELFLIDHHHFGLALWQSEIETAYAQVVDDKSHLIGATFWRTMEAAGRLYPFDEEGLRVAPHQLPLSLGDLRHDPFRDLAWDVREAGGYHKSPIPYAEFRWANFFRERMSIRSLKRDQDAALKRALKLSRSKAAAELPGYHGRHAA